MLQKEIYTKSKIKIVTKIYLKLERNTEMCGIVGFIGKKKSLPILINGLKRLEYRGYDSAGVAYLANDGINIVKAVGRIKDLENKLKIDDESYMGIGHTRWATHGGVSEINSHPHCCGDIVIVHNGIIENYLEIKNFLLSKGYSFYGETDTEVAASYIDYEYKNSDSKDMIEVLSRCMKRFVGSYAIVVMVNAVVDKLFVMKKDSPLVILRGDEEAFIASDVSAYSKEASEYVVLNDLEIGIVSKNEITIYKDERKREIKFNKIDDEISDDDLAGFKHYMLKEINEESSLLKKWNEFYLDDLKNLNNLIDLGKFSRIHIIGCGTAYHAGMVGKYLIEIFSDTEVNVFIASEYRYQKLFIDEGTLVIAISQSGETADTLACIRRIKELGVKTLGIINVMNSSIARSVDEVIYTKAGTEVAVASTKAYLSQVYILSLLAVKLGIKNKLLDKTIFDEYRKLPKLVNKMIHMGYKDVSKVLAKANNIFYLGRSIDYVTALEGALKLKEISYIHSEAYASGELKHGTISLIENGTPVIGLITDEEIASKTVSNIIEVKARGAYVILLVSKKLAGIIEDKVYDELIVIDDIHKVIRPMLSIIPLQLIAYYTALRKGCDIDKPRNLAKSVTVE